MKIEIFESLLHFFREQFFYFILFFLTVILHEIWEDYFVIGELNPTALKYIHRLNTHPIHLLVLFFHLSCYFLLTFFIFLFSSKIEIVIIIKEILYRKFRFKAVNLSSRFSLYKFCKVDLLKFVRNTKRGFFSSIGQLFCLLASH